MPHVRRVAVFTCLFAILTLFVESTSAAAFKHVHEGDEMPTFTLPTLDGTPLDLKAYHGEGPLTILVFWALWSPNSAPQLEDVQKLVDEFGAKGLKAVAVNADGTQDVPDLENQVKDFVAKHGLRFPMALDKELEQYNAWGVIASPATAFLGQGGKLSFEFSGHPTSAYRDMRDKTMELLGLQEEVAEARKPKHARYHPSDKKVTLNYGLAKTQYGRGQFTKALDKLEKVLEADPAYPDAHALNGAIHLGLEQEGKADAAAVAREAFAKAVELDGALPLGLAGTAHFALLDGDVGKALELARQAVEHTEPEDLPDLEVADSGSAGTTEESGAQAASGGQPQAAGTPAAAEEQRAAPMEKAGGEEAKPGAVILLEEAAQAQQDGKADEAKALVARVIDGLIAVPEGPGEKARKMLEMMKKKP